MKITAILLLILILSSPVVFAQGQGGRGNETNETDQGNGEVQEVQTEETQERPNVIAPQQIRVRTEDIDALRRRIQQRQEEMNQETERLRERVQKVFRNQNRVRMAVHALLAMENFTGGIGPQVSAIAREFNNSVKVTVEAEEKIQNRNFLARLFMGGDNKAAGELEQEMGQNQKRIQRLRQLMGDCNCTQEIKNMFQEQVENMEVEQKRLRVLAEKEKKSKGLFGWLFK